MDTIKNTSTEKPADFGETTRPKGTQQSPAKRQKNMNKKRKLGRRQRKTKYREAYKEAYKHTGYVDHYCNECQHNLAGLFDHYCPCSHDEARRQDHNCACSHQYEQGDDHYCPCPHTLSRGFIDEELLNEIDMEARNRVAGVSSELVLDY